MAAGRMERKFNRIYKKASSPKNMIPVDWDRDFFVIFSDHHKGDGSSADDFRKNADLYRRALFFYQERSFPLIVLGDNEELWESSYSQIYRQYGELIGREVEMALSTAEKKKIRIWGNHDKEVSLRRFVKTRRKVGAAALKNVAHREGLCLGRDIFLVHGHQGRFFEDIAWKISRWAVKMVWKSIQKLFRIGIDGPSENNRLRESLELKYYRWAKENRLLLICGHTHRAIFASFSHKGLPMGFFEPPEQDPVPCYFNSGCCCYSDGMTCLELEKGTIRLVAWKQPTGERITLAEEELGKILAAIQEGRPSRNKPVPGSK